jgi:large subunit ribosomal protein L1
MPNPKTGTVTQDVGQTVAEFKAGRVEFRNDRYGNVHVPIGRVSFEADLLAENLAMISEEIIRSRPAAAKGGYVEHISISSTMGPSVRVDYPQLEDLVADYR